MCAHLPADPVVVEVHVFARRVSHFAAVEEALGELIAVLPVDAAAAPLPAVLRVATRRLADVTAAAHQLATAAGASDHVA